MVQLGSFSANNNAEKLANQLREEGFSAQVSSFRSGNKTMYRVQIGPKKDRATAEKLVAKLQKAGHKGLVMPVTP